MSDGSAWRSQWPIAAYCGANGSGKTLLMMADTMGALDAGRQVLSTVRIVDYENPRPCSDPACTSPLHPDHGAAHPNWIPLTNLNQLVDAEHCDILLDEVTGIASARESMSLPAAVANMLVQLRRRDCKLRWTSPSWARADRVIRECTQIVNLSRGWMSREVEGQSWRSATLISWRTLDARDFDDLTDGRKDRASSLRKGVARVSKIRGRNAYQTLDTVLAASLPEGGRCVICGGRKHVPACAC